MKKNHLRYRHSMLVGQKTDMQIRDAHPPYTPLPSFTHSISHMTFDNLWRKKRCLISHPTETTPGFSARYRCMSWLFLLPMISPDIRAKVSSSERLTVKERKCERRVHHPCVTHGRDASSRRRVSCVYDVSEEKPSVCVCVCVCLFVLRVSVARFRLQITNHLLFLS